MNIHYISMRFPAPSETFASNDVRALHEAGADIHVHSLLPAHAASDALILERDLQNVPLSFGGRAEILRGLAVAARNPRLLARAIAGIVRHCWRQPEYLAKSLALVPRALGLFDHLDRADPHIVHIYWGHYPSLVGYLVQSERPDLIVTMSLGAYDLERRYGLSRPVAQRAAFVRTTSTVNVEQIRDAFGVSQDTVVVIYDGIDIDYVVGEGAACQSMRSAASRREAEPGRKRIISAGSLRRHKRMDAVIDVFARVVQRHPTASLTILGDGPEGEALRDRARTLGVADAVEFGGHVPHEAVHGAMAESDVFLFLSEGRGERLPNVVKEAMANGCICVVSDTPGIHELIPDEEHGYVVGSDLDRAAQRVSALLDDEALRLRIREKARAYILERFDRTTSIQTYLRLWSDQVRQRPGAAEKVS